MCVCCVVSCDTILVIADYCIREKRAIKVVSNKCICNNIIAHAKTKLKIRRNITELGSGNLESTREKRSRKTPSRTLFFRVRRKVILYRVYYIIYYRHYYYFVFIHNNIIIFTILHFIIIVLLLSSSSLYHLIAVGGTCHCELRATELVLYYYIVLYRSFN